jgi:hypothetical protein
VKRSLQLKYVQLDFENILTQNLWFENIFLQKNMVILKKFAFSFSQKAVGLLAFQFFCAVQTKNQFCHACGNVL